MKLFSKILSVVMIIYLTGCASVDVKHDYDSDYDYSSLKTYKWYEVKAPSEVSELRVKRMVEAADAEHPLRLLTRDHHGAGQSPSEVPRR